VIPINGAVIDANRAAIGGNGAMIGMNCAAIGMNGAMIGINRGRICVSFWTFAACRKEIDLTGARYP
jgi:hypothetical protein